MSQVKASGNTRLKKIKKGMTSWVRFFAKHNDPLAKVLLKQGVWFEGRADSHDYEATNAWRKARRPKIKECYYNAQMYCMYHDDARYFEGLVESSVGGYIPHAWVVLPDGQVIDFTWEALDRNLRRDGIPSDTSKAVYFGVEVPTPEFCKVIAATGVSGPYYG